MLLSTDAGDLTGPPYTATSLLLAGRHAEAAQMTQQIIEAACRRRGVIASMSGTA